MEKKLVTLLMAIIETPLGETYEEAIGRKEGETTFTQEEIDHAIKVMVRTLGKGYMICDTYEALIKVWY